MRDDARSHIQYHGADGPWRINAKESVHAGMNANCGNEPAATVNDLPLEGVREAIATQFPVRVLNSIAVLALLQRETSVGKRAGVLVCKPRLLEAGKGRHVLHSNMQALLHMPRSKFTKPKPLTRPSDACSTCRPVGRPIS